MCYHYVNFGSTWYTVFCFVMSKLSNLNHLFISTSSGNCSSCAFGIRFNSWSSAWFQSIRFFYSGISLITPPQNHWYVSLCSKWCIMFIWLFWFGGWKFLGHSYLLQCVYCEKWKLIGNGMSLLQYSVCSLGNGNKIIAAKCWNSVVSAQLGFNICMGYS